MTQSINPEANAQFHLGLSLKQNGQADNALTAFRRAVLADPLFQKAHVQVGYLCRDKAELDPLFLRYAFDAFQKAARLDLTDEEAHNQYIMMGQKVHRLDELQSEYRTWANENPENEFLQQCNKNILTISMAMIPQNISIAGSDNAKLRKLALIGSIAALTLGFVLMLTPPLLVKSGKLKKENVSSMVKSGLLIEIMGIAGFIVRSKL